MNNQTLPQASLGVRIFGSASYTLISSSGIVLNILLILVLGKSKKTFKQNAFYTITWQLIFCDFLTHLIEFTVPIPITLAGFDIYGETLLLYIPCFAETLAYNATLFFSFLMTINRFTVFLLPSVNVFFFRDGLFVTIGCVWLFTVIYVTLMNLFACYKTFDSGQLLFKHVCKKQDITPFGSLFRQTTLSVSQYLPILMFATYIFIIIYIKIKLRYEMVNGRITKRATTTGHSQTRRELSLLAQGFVICGFFEIEQLSYTSLPKLQAQGQWIFIMTFIGSWISLMLNTIHPIVLFTFNKEIRTRLVHLLFRRTNVLPISTVSSHPSH